MENKIEKYNEEAYAMLNASGYNIRDKFLNELKFFHADDVPCLKLSFGDDEEEVVFELEFRNLVQFDYYFHEHFSTAVEDYKLIRLKNGEYYLSLDPFNMTKEKSDDDGDVIIAKELVLLVNQ